MSNVTLNPRSGADRARIIEWCGKHDYKVGQQSDTDGNVVIEVDRDNLQATIALGSLKGIAHFDDVSK